MNKFEDLVSHGMKEFNAREAIDSCKQRIGTLSGINEITDVNYDFDNRRKIITLTCTKCGNTAYRNLDIGRTDWKRLRKSCSCQKNSKIKKEKKIRPEKQIVPELKHSDVIWKEYQFMIGTRSRYLKVEDVIKVHGYTKLLCRCDCGNYILLKPAYIKTGATKSCGCKTKELVSENSKIHGYSGERLYRVYSNMLRRCFDEKADGYHCYGGRGITVCQEWKDDYTVFRDWAMGAGYNPYAERGECTIDRIDVNGDYKPTNCRWISNDEQQKNKRASSEWKKRERILYNFNGEYYNLDEIHEKFGIEKQTFKYRIKKGMSVSEAILTPLNPNGRKRIS